MLSQVLYTSPCLIRIRSFMRQDGSEQGELTTFGPWDGSTGWAKECFSFSWADAPERAGVCGLSEQCNLADDPGAGIQMVRATRSGWLSLFQPERDQAVNHRAGESVNAWANSDEPVVACEDHEAVWDERLVVTSDVRGSLMKQTRWLTRLEPSVRCWTSSMVAPMPGLTRRFGSVELESNLIGSCDTPLDDQE